MHFRMQIQTVGIYTVHVCIVSSLMMTTMLYSENIIKVITFLYVLYLKQLIQ